jgi:vacuolar protein sorting-associated protein 53
MKGTALMSLLLRRFSKLVNRGFNRMETLLKAVMTPSDPVEGFIESYIFLIADKNTNNFQKIMDIKVRDLK